MKTLGLPLLSLSLCLFLSACETIQSSGPRTYKIWYKEGVTAAQAQQDYAGCQMIAAVNNPLPNLPPADVVLANNRNRAEVIKYGMLSKGYTIQRLSIPEAKDFPRP